MSTAGLRNVHAIHAEGSRQLCVSVLFTDVQSTLRALSKADGLAAGLNAGIEVLAPVVVPYPLPMDEAPIGHCHTVRSLRTIAGATSVATRVNVIYCRDRADALRSLLKPDSVLILAWKERWLFDGTSRLISDLRREGYHVIVVGETKGA